MRILRPIVEALVGPGLDIGHDIAHGAIPAQLVGEDNPRCAALALQQFSHKTLCRFGIAGFGPERRGQIRLERRHAIAIVSYSDRKNGLVEMPFVAKATGRAPADLPGKLPAKPFHPQSYCLMRDDDAASSQHVLGHP